MTAPNAAAVRQRLRDLQFLQQPRWWPQWPYLPLVRRRPEGEDELGVLYDAFGVSGRTGYSATVIFANLCFLPDTEEALLALPREVFDTPEEIVDAGWHVD